MIITKRVAHNNNNNNKNEKRVRGNRFIMRVMYTP